MSTWGFDLAQQAYDNAVPTYLEDNDYEFEPDYDRDLLDWDEEDER